ncbi:MAG: UDP-N-acetylglucosamine 4,6-dehydratase (inverting) [bacterium]
MLSGKSLLITGGTGSFGKELVKTLLSRHPKIKRLVVYSRDELKQFEMAQAYPDSTFPQMRYFIGDVRDKERLYRAMRGIDVVVHAAALKQVPACEYNPFEAIKTNVLGAQNVIECAIDRDVQTVVALSTDKAAAPINLYGATKLCSDKLFASANNYSGKSGIKFGVVRYGNVLGSRGSVVPFFQKRRASGTLPITDKRMTRFNITLEEGVDLVLYAMTHMWGGEIFVPKIPSYRITDLAEAVAPECAQAEVGIRPGEKIHEEMITETDAYNSLEFDDHYVILPSMPTWDVAEYMLARGGRRCRPGFSYNSGRNSRWLSVDQLRQLISEQVNKSVGRHTVGSAREYVTDSSCKSLDRRQAADPHRLTLAGMRQDLKTVLNAAAITN